jgi:hypothetical protein
MEFSDLFSFDKKIAPAIVKPLYWFLMLLILFLGVVFFLTGFFGLFYHFWAGLWQMLMSVILVPLSVLALRVAAEVSLAVFEIHERGAGTTPTQM